MLRIAKFKLTEVNRNIKQGQLTLAADHQKAEDSSSVNAAKQLNLSQSESQMRGKSEQKKKTVREPAFKK
jgi:hypothetical protein